jgi:hypothetical protein
MTNFYSKLPTRRSTLEAALDHITELLRTHPRSPHPRSQRDKIHQQQQAASEASVANADVIKEKERAPTMRMAMSAMSQSVKAAPVKDVGNTSDRLPSIKHGSDPHSSDKSLTGVDDTSSRKISILTINVPKYPSLLSASPTAAAAAGILAGKMSTIEAEVLGYTALKALQDTLGHRYVYCRHLCSLFKYFNPSPTTLLRDFALDITFGSFAVDLLVSLYSRIVDLHNIEFILDNWLSPEDVGAFVCRVGWLNVFNPMKPVGHWILNMALNEERFVAKCLVATHVIDRGKLNECIHITLHLFSCW